MASIDLLIEPATETDEPFLVQLLQTLFEQEAEFHANSENQIRGLRMIMMAPDVGSIMVAKMQGRVVGMVNLLFTVSTALGAKVAMLEDMVIAPDVRGAGVGSMLLSAAIAEAQRAGCQRITLLSDMRPMRRLL